MKTEQATESEKVFPMQPELEDVKPRGVRRVGGLTNRTAPRLSNKQLKARAKSKRAKLSRKRNRV